LCSKISYAVFTSEHIIRDSLQLILAGA